MSAFFPKAPLTIQVTDKDVQRAFELYKTALAPIFANPLLSGAMLQNVTITSAGTAVPHGLQRDYIGWWVIDLQGNSVLWRDVTSTLDKSNYLVLLSSAPSVICNLWVF